MNNQLSTQIFKTGALVKVYMCSIPKNAYRYGVTVLLKNELLIVFKNGSIIKRFDPYSLFFEYICATYLVDETFKSIEDILLQFQLGRFYDVFKNIHEHA
jgi:hypothetical protein